MNQKKPFYEDPHQTWTEIFRQRDRIRRLEKLEKTQYLLSVFNFAAIAGLIINSVVFWDKLR